MQAQRFRRRLFYLLLGTKFIVFLWLFILWLAKAYAYDQFRELFFLIVPLFTTNITIAVNFWLKDRKRKSTKIDPPFSQPIRVIVFLGSILYGLFILVLLTYFSTLSGSEKAFSNLKDMVGLAEIVFGGYLGLIVIELFKNPD